MYYAFFGNCTTCTVRFDAYLVVLGDILVESAHEDHGHHEGQEDHDEDGVDDGEPVHAVRHRMVHRQVHIPAGSPFHLGHKYMYVCMYE